MNQEAAKLCFEISAYLQAQNVSFKPWAWRKAAQAIEEMEEDISSIYQKGGIKALEEIPGVGKTIAQSLEEYIKTGKMSYFSQLKKQMPVEMQELTAVQGLGPRKVRTLYKELGVKNLKQLEQAAKKGKIKELETFGEKSQENILEGIEFVKKSQGRYLLGEIMPLAQQMLEKLKKIKGTIKIDICGSLRRRKETIGDLDFLAVCPDPQGLIDAFCKMPEVQKVFGQGDTKANVKLNNGLDVDLRVVPASSFGAAQQYFTGSKEHNIQLRKIAIKKGLKLNEYGLFKGEKAIAGKTEEEIYQALDMDWIVPELRENTGEIEMGLAHSLPKLIELKNIKGDLHVHSNWDGGVNSIKELAQYAIDLGYEYIGISDHTQFLKIEHGLNEKQLAEQRKEIDKLNKEFVKKGIKFKIFQGCEANILNDGSLDIDIKALSSLDYVIAGLHSSFKMEKAQMTQRIIKAMQNPYVKIISHPTGRILKQRGEYEIDIEALIRAAKTNRVALEINASPYRLDLDANNIRKAIQEGVKLVINSDTHAKDQMHHMQFGIFQARRGLATAKNVINTQGSDKLFDF